MYRQTYLEIDTKKIADNINYLLNNYKKYQYFIGVVKNIAYGHGMEIVNTLIENGINYLAVSSVEEALEIRKIKAEIPILILEPIEIEFLSICEANNLTITIDNWLYLKQIKDREYKNPLKVHLKIDTGMNRLGLKSKEDLLKSLKYMKENKGLILEGLYSHFSTSGLNDSYYEYQLNNFRNMTNEVNLNEIPIVHFDRSLTLINQPPISFCNGCRIGISMFGISAKKPNLSFNQKLRLLIKKVFLGQNVKFPKRLKLETAFALYSKVISLRKGLKGELVGYGNYKLSADAYIATLAIGFADGVDKSFKYVYLKGKKYPIVSSTMDMIMIKVDQNVQIGDLGEIVGQNISVEEVCENIGQNAYHLFSRISTRVERKYK